MKKLLSFLFVACFTATLFAQSFVSTTPSNKNVILEEYTGTNCGYCPDGHKIADNIAKANPGRAWSINIHQGGYSGNNPQYKTNWANPLANQYGVNSYPIGTVNRGTSAIGRGSWTSASNQILAQPSPVNVAAKGYINTSNRKLILVVEVYYTGNAAETTNRLNVAMLQNNIMGPQASGSTYPEMWIDGQYKHNHMLRDLITGQWGIDIPITTAGSFWTHTFEYDIPEYITYNGSTANTPLVVLADLDFLVFVAENQKTILSGTKADIEFTTPTLHTVAGSAGANGTIFPEGVKNFVATTCAFYSFTPAQNYKVDKVFVDGAEVGTGITSYVIQNINKNYTINATFKAKPIYKINATAGDNGSISPAGEKEYFEDETPKYTFTANSGYRIDEVLVDGNPVTISNNSYTFTALKENHTIHVKFKAIPTYKITASAGPNGAISPNGEKEYEENSTPKYTFSSNSNYVVDEVLVDGVPVTFSNNSYTFPALKADHTIHVTFKSTISYKIIATAGENGTISPDGEKEYQPGENAEYTFTPANDSYRVDKVLVDGESVVFENNSYTFTAIDKNHTIHVTFTIKEGIKDVNGVPISVAPNPMNDELIITGLYDNLEIFSISGQLLLNAINQPSVDVTQLSKGVYFVKIQVNGQECTFKVIKN